MIPVISKKYANKYDESCAILVSESRQIVENTGVALRMFKVDMDMGEVDACINEMWATRLYIDNPTAARQAGVNDNTFKLAGRWAVANLRKNHPDEPKGIYEELRLGYLQPPGTVGAFPAAPNPTDAQDWSAIDTQARVLSCNELDSTQRQISGKNQYYTVIFPGVATKTVKEFCIALTKRSNLANPTFGLQTALQGTYKFAGVRNEENGGGGSTVYATLAFADGFNPDGVIFNNNWNELVAHIWYSNLPQYPTELPLANVPAVEDASNWRNQASPAKIYQIAGAEIDERGLWNLTVISRIAKPSIVEFFVNDTDGAYAQILFFNQTLAWVQKYTTLVLSGGFRNSMRPPMRNEFDLYSGHIEIRPQQNSGEYVNTTGTDTFIEEVHDRLGNVWKITYLADFVWSKDAIWGNLTSARAAYDALNPASYHSGDVKIISFFFPRGKGHYEFKAYTWIRRTAVKLTAATSLYSTSSVNVYGTGAP